MIKIRLFGNIYISFLRDLQDIAGSTKEKINNIVIQFIHNEKSLARHMIWDTISFLVKKGIKHIGVPLTKSGGKFLLLELYRKFEKMYPGLISNSEDNFNRKYIK